MSPFAGRLLRLTFAPAVVAAFAGVELWHFGALAAIGVGWCVFALCVFASGAWGRIQLEQAGLECDHSAGRRSTRMR